MHFLRRASLRCVVDIPNFSRGQELTTRLADFYSTLVKNSASVHECIEQLLGLISVKCLTYNHPWKPKLSFIWKQEFAVYKFVI